MRAAGIIIVLVALVLLAYGWFALAWDGGTSRVVEDWILIGLGALLLAGGAGMVAEQAWGLKLAIAIGVLLCAAVAFQTLLSVQKAGKAPKLALYELPVRERVGDDLGDEWWATPVERLRELRRQNDAIAKDWEIQGDDRTRLVVITDAQLPIVEGRVWPLNVFVVINTGKTRLAQEVFTAFYSVDRVAPVELRLVSGADRNLAIVVARGEQGCASKTFSLDHRAGTISPIENAPSACP